jgi:general secretion pathway protein A
VLAPWIRWLAAGGAAAGVALIAVVLWRAWPAAEAPETAATTAEAPATPAPDPAPAAAPREALGTVLAKDAEATSPDAAFGSLFALWGAQFEPGSGLACEQAVVQGLSCVWQRGSLAQLKLINRPAILSLVDSQGSSHQVVLAELGDGEARLRLGGAEAQVPIAELADFWFGEFLVLWRPQAAGHRPLRAGMRGDDVRWLRQGLEQLSGLPASPPPADYFDAELQQLVEGFQRSRRLAVDGVAGLQTQLVLDAALGAPGTPTLSHAAPQAGA